MTKRSFTKRRANGGRIVHLTKRFDRTALCGFYPHGVWHGGSMVAHLPVCKKCLQAKAEIRKSK